MESKSTQLEKDRRKMHRTIIGQIGDFSFEAEIAGFSQDVIPLDSFQQLVIELPKGAAQRNIRSAFHRTELKMGEEEPIDEKMAIGLPIYIKSRYCPGLDRSANTEPEITFRGLKIPILGITQRIEGVSCDNCIPQRITSLFAWNDEQVRLLDFDLIERSSHGSINLEGAIEISKEMKFEQALDVFRMNAEKICQLENCHIFLFLAPLALGREVRRFKTRTRCSKRVWQREWRYSDSQKAQRDLQDTLNIVKFRY